MTKQIAVHLPDDLHARVKAAAEHDRRSLHSELLYAVEFWLAARDAVQDDSQASK